MPRSRRRFDIEEEMAFQTSVSGSSRRDPASRSIPTPDTQELYDAMRRIEDDLTFGDHLRLQDGTESNDGHDDYLRIASPSLPPTSPSCTSTTNSASRGLDDVELDEYDRIQRRRAVRHGPLDALDRAQAALMRKLGACMDCKLRKVKCTHFDRTLFEQQYQVYVRSARAARANARIADAIEAAEAAAAAAAVTATATAAGTSASGASPGGTSATVGSPGSAGLSTITQPSFNNGTATEIGSWQTSCLSLQSVSGNQNDEAHAEIQAIEDDVRNASATSANTTAPFYHTSHATHTTPPRTQNNPFTSMNLKTCPSRTPASVSSGLTVPEVNPVPICRRVGDTMGIMWECRNGDDAISTSEDQAAICSRRFQSFHELCIHFQSEHSNFEDPFVFWKCAWVRECDDGVARVCGFLSAEASISCFLCQANHWEQWWYATLSKTPSLTSGPSVRVDSRDGSTAGGYWQGGFGSSQLPSSQGQLDFQLLFPGRYMGGNRGGSCYSASAKSSKAKTRDHCFRSVSVYPQGCPYGKKCRSLRQTSEYITKAQFLAVISVLFLIVMEQWLVAGVSLLSSRGIAPLALDVARVHIRLMSLICVVAGLVGMWLFKYAKFRPDADRNVTAAVADPNVSVRPVTWTNLHLQNYPRCVSLDFPGVSRDVEGVGSMLGDDKTPGVCDANFG